MEEIKIRDLRRIFGCSFRCNVGRIVGYVTGVTAENTAEKTSKARILIFSKALITLAAQSGGMDTTIMAFVAVGFAVLAMSITFTYFTSILGHP